MKFKKFKLVLITMFLFLVTGCVNEEQKIDVQKRVEVEENYFKIRELAWNFLKERGWHSRAKEDWESSTVTKIIVNEKYELLDKSYEGKEVFSVSFKDKEHVVVGTPLVLVDANTNEVIGFMPGE